VADEKPTSPPPPDRISTTYRLTTMRIVGHGHEAPAALYVKIVVECDACAGQVLEFWGHLVRGLRDVLDQVIAEHPDLTHGDTLKKLSVAPVMRLNRRNGDPSLN
jgi:hypothetical protein